MQAFFEKKCIIFIFILITKHFLSLIVLLLKSYAPVYKK